MNQLFNPSAETLIGWSTSQLVNNSLTTPVTTTSDLYSPIGAFYESKSIGTDNAVSIANKTFRILNSAKQAVSANQLAALDANKDGKLNGAELNGLNAWADNNEDGLGQTAELSTLATALANAGLTSVRATDYSFYTAGNATYQTPTQSTAIAPSNTRVAPGTPAAQASNYSALRYSDNRFYINSYMWIDWASNQIKLSSNQLNLVGTDGNDSFDINYYAAYNGKYFNLGLIQNFYAGGGNDLMGGSSRNDSLWGGTGNDTLDANVGNDGRWAQHMSASSNDPLWQKAA